jgi:hypothetical protein
MLHRISPVLFASVLAGAFVVMSSLPAGADASGERRDRLHPERPVAAPRETPVFVDPDLAAQIEAAEAAEHAAAAEMFAAAIREQEAQSRGTGGAVSSARSESCNGDVACFLECTRAHESDTSGGYGAVSSGGTYRGAYQFQQSTWDAAVAGAGWAEFSGIPADQAPAEIQDAAAVHLYSVAGTRPWGGRC